MLFDEEEAPASTTTTPPATTPTDDGEFTLFSDAIRRLDIASAGVASRQPVPPPSVGPGNLDSGSGGALRALRGGGSIEPQSNEVRSGTFRIPDIAEQTRFLQRAIQEMDANDSYTAEKVASDARALGYAPEVMSFLIEEWEYAGTAAQVLSALHDQVNVDDYRPVLGRVEAQPAVRDFVDEFGSEFTPDEKEMVLLMLASTEAPTADSLPSFKAQAKSLFQQAFGPGLIEGVTTAEAIHEKDIAGKVERAQNNIAAKAIQKLRETPIKTDRDRRKFLLWVFNETRSKQHELEFEMTGFGGFADTFQEPFRASSGRVSQGLSFITGPADYSHRRYLSFGQNAAVIQGYTPDANSDDLLTKVIRGGLTGVSKIPIPDWIPLAGGLDETAAIIKDDANAWELVSGAWDFGLNLSPVDPINALSRVSKGIKLSKTVQRLPNVSKGRLVAKSFVPGANRWFDDIPKTTHGFTGRLSFALASETRNNLLTASKNPKVARLYKKFADITDAAEIERLAPELAGKENLKNALALPSVNTPAKVEVVMKWAGEGAFSSENVMAMELLDNAVAASTRKYAEAWDEATRSGRVSLAGLADGVDQYTGNGVWELPGIPLVEKDVTIKHAFGSRKVSFQVAESGEFAFQGSPNPNLQTVGTGGISLAPGRSVGYTSSGGRVYAIRIADLPQDLQDVLRSGQDIERVLGRKEVGAIAKFIDEAKKGRPMANPDLRDLLGIEAGVGDPAWLRRVIDDIESDLGKFVGVAGPDDLESVAEYLRSVPRFGNEALITTADIPGAKPAAVFTSAEVKSGLLSGRLETPGVYKASEVAMDGSSKVIIPTGIVGDFRVFDNTKMTRWGQWVTKHGNPTAEAAYAKLADGKPLSQLTTAELNELKRFLNATGQHAAKFGDELVTTRKGQNKLRTVQDIADENTKALDALESPLTDYMRSVTTRNSVNGPRELWIFSDIPGESLAKNIGRKGLDKLGRPASGYGNVSRAWRSLKSTMVDRIPDHISTSDVASGNSALKGWMRALGATKEDVAKWSNLFTAAPSAQVRRQVLFEAFMDIGDKIEQPLLRHNVLEFVQREAGLQGFERGTDGIDIGAKFGLSGPIGTSMMTDKFVMPHWNAVKGTMRRYRHTKGIAQYRVGRRWLEGVGKTKGRRKSIRKSYEAQLRQRMPKQTWDELNKDDLWAMAYADVLGGGQGAWANNFYRLVAKPYKGFHTVFSLSQLAGRPMAWGGRVQIEEQVRGLLFDLPNVIAHPYEFMNVFMENRGIRKLAKRQMRMAKAADDILVKWFDDSVPDAVLHAQLREVIPTLDSLAADAGVDLARRGDLQVLVSRIVGSDIKGSSSIANPSKLGRRGNPLRRGLNRYNKDVKKTKQLLVDEGLDPDFTFDRVPEIANRSMSHTYTQELVSGSFPMEMKHGGMNRNQVKQFGHSWARQADQVVNTADTRAALNLRLDRLRGTNKFKADRVIRSRYWGELKERALEVARKNNWEYADEAELATRYFDEVLGEWVDAMFSPFWGDDPIQMERILTRLVDDKVLDVNIGGSRIEMLIDGKNTRKLRTDGADLARAAYDNKIQMSPINGWIEARLGDAAPDRAWWRRLADWNMQFFGETVTQEMSRRPAWRRTHQRYFDWYKKMGWEDELADIVAWEKASELTNYVFFNNMGASRFLRSMNNVVPFFSAWWEVMSTWFYKIPAQEHLFIGYPHLIRQVDRTLDMMVNTGMATVSPDGQSFNFELSDDPNTNKPLGKAFSVWALNTMRSPFVIAEHAVNLGASALQGMGADVDDVDFTQYLKDGMTFTAGNPLNPFSSGLMSVNQWGFGFSPLLSYAAQKVYNNINFGVDEKKADGNKGESLLEVVERNPDFDPDLFLRYNQDVLRDAIGFENLKALNAGEVEPSDLILKSDVSLSIPESTLMRQFTDQTFFPFGQYDGEWGPIPSVVPTWASYALRGWGLYDNDDSGFPGFLTTAFGPVSQYQVGAEKIRAYMHLEASEGLFTKQRRLVQKAHEAYEATGRGVLETFDYLPGDTPEEERYNDLYEQVEFLNEKMARRAAELAGGSMIARAIAGFAMPSTPRLFYEEQRQAASYWATREVVDAAKASGSENFVKAFGDRVLGEAKVTTVEDFEDILTMISLWFEDGTGDEIKKWVRVNHPGLEPFLQGTTFWGPSGPPPEIRDFEAFFDQVESGERAVIPEDVYLVRNMRNGLIIDKELDITLRYGKEPKQQLMGYLYDGLGWEELTDTYDRGFEALEWFDAELNDNAYENWRNRNNQDSFTVLSRLEEEFRMARDTIDELELGLDFLNLPASEKRKVIGQVSAGYRQIFETIDQYKRVVDDRSEWENPRERLVSEYFSNVANPYYEKRNEIFEKLAFVDTEEERSAVFDELRVAENEHFLATHTVDGSRVPSEIERSWNKLNEEERHYKRLDALGKKPEWLSVADVQHIIEEAPTAAQYLPSSQTDWTIYNKYANWGKQAYEDYKAGVLSKGELAKNREFLEETMLNELWDSGRATEVEYREAWPAHRLALIGMLPRSLYPALEQVNTIKDDLRAAEVGPSSEYGERLRIWFNGWMREYYTANPQVLDDLQLVGDAMFGEQVPTAINARLFFDVFNSGVE